MPKQPGKMLSAHAQTVDSDDPAAQKHKGILFMPKQSGKMLSAREQTLGTKRFNWIKTQRYYRHA
jgi:hypothetical protein